MADAPEKPAEPLAFIQACVREGRVLWTYHVAMRLGARKIDRQAILGCVESYEVIEEYPDDKYLPSYLVLAEAEGEGLHILFATDVADRNVRVVTAYRPDPEAWEDDLKVRKVP